jgi:hypothetical protein
MPSHSELICAALAALAALCVLVAQAVQYDRARRARFGRRIHCRRLRLQGRGCLPGRCYFPACPDDCGPTKGDAK